MNTIPTIVRPPAEDRLDAPPVIHTLLCQRELAAFADGATGDVIAACTQEQRLLGDVADEGDKVEPFYFDARRGPNAHSRDVGFSPNDLSLTTTAFPAVEFLCLVGLQRCLPAKTDKPRIYDYFTWTEPLTPALLPAAVSGLLPHVGSRGYRFENWFRTGQRKHKAFRSAIPLSPRGAQ